MDMNNIQKTPEQQIDEAVESSKILLLPQKSLNPSSNLVFKNLYKFCALTGYDLPTC